MAIRSPQKIHYGMRNSPPNSDFSIKLSPTKSLFFQNHRGGTKIPENAVKIHTQIKILQLKNNFKSHCPISI